MNLKKIYPIFPEFEYIYYIKEGEFRTYLSKKSDNDKTIAILKMLKKVYDYWTYDFSSEEEIKDFTNYDYWNILNIYNTYILIIIMVELLFYLYSNLF